MTIERIYDYFERNPRLHVLFLFDKDFLEGELDDVRWRRVAMQILFGPVALFEYYMENK